MKFKENNKAQKASHNILSDFIIDLQSFIELAPQVYSKNAAAAPDFNEACDFLRDLCDEMSMHAPRIKEILPAKKVEGEIS